MAIPNWLQVTPKEGSNNKEISLVASRHTGRTDRSGSIVGTTSKTASATLPVTQKGHDVYITLKSGEAIKSCTMTATTVTVEGASNAANLKLASTSTVISGVVATLGVNTDGSTTYTAVSGWDGITKTAVPASYGEAAEYSFKITFSIPENQTLSARKHILRITNAETDSAVSTQIEITQSAGYYTYSDIVVKSFTYPTATAGQTSALKPSISYSQTYGWNGRTSGVGTVTSGAALSYESTSSALDKTTGEVAVSSKGTTISNTTVVAEVTATVTLNGKTKTATTSAQQAGNYVESLELITYAFKYDSVSAGATSASPSASTPGVSYVYSSGSSSSSTPGSVYGSMSVVTSYSLEKATDGFTGVDASTGVLTVTARGTEIGLARVSGKVTRSVTATWTPAAAYNAKGTKTASDSKTATCSQAENLVTSILVSVSPFTYPTSVAASGSNTVDPTSAISVTFVYSSGARGTSTPNDSYGTFVQSTKYSGTAANGFSAPNEATGRMTCANRTTTVGAARNSGDVTLSYECTFTHDVTYLGKKVTGSGSAVAHATQVANAVTYGDVVASGDYSSANDDIPASGGTRATIKAASASQKKTYTSGSSLACTVTSSWSTAVTVASLGTTAKSRAKVGTLTVTWTGEGSKTATKTYEVYQGLNAITAYLGVTIDQTTPVSLAADGQDYVISKAISQFITYTSGATRKRTTPVSGTFTVKTASAGFSLDADLGKVTVTENPGVTQRGSFVVTYSVTGEGNTTASKDITFTQHASDSYINFSPNVITFEAAGGTKTVTLNSNDSWTIS